MKDWLFYPLVLGVAALIVAFALTRGEAQVVVDVETARANGYRLAGPDLMDLTASPGTELLVGETSTRALMVEDRASAPPSAGVFATLVPVYEEAFGGRELEVVWRLRRPDGPGQVELGYFSIGSGDSGWRARAVGPEWQDVSLRYAPRAPTEPGFDYVGMWPGTGEPDGAPIEIESVSVRVVD